MQENNLWRNQKLNKKTIDATITINNTYSIDVQSIKHISQYLSTIMTYQESLEFAHEIANQLNDREAFPLYLTYVTKYPEAELRKFLKRTLEVPKDKIRKTRGALFTYLVEQYAKSESNSSQY